LQDATRGRTVGGLVIGNDTCIGAAAQSAPIEGASRARWRSTIAKASGSRSAIGPLARQDGHVFEGFALRWVDVDDDVRLRVRVGGDGPPVVLLHGHPRTHTTWHAVAPLLVAAGHTVVCPDLRGYGRSSAPPARADHAQASKGSRRNNLGFHA
jgi:hypothetical protein